MAGDWLPIRTDLPDDPAVISIAAACDLPETHVVGILVKLWSWANRHLSDGHARGVTETWVDRYTCVTGFAKAMIEAGWLTRENGHVSFPKFDNWNSHGAKKRLLSSKRKVEQRSRECHALCVTKTRPEKSREEKSKEEKYTPQPPADAGGAVVETPKPARRERKQASSAGPESIPIPDALNHDPFPATWAEWIAERRERRKPLTARAAKGQLLGLEPLGPVKAAECVSASIRNGWAGLFPESADVKAKPPPTRFPTKQEIQMAEFAADQAVVEQARKTIAERNGKPHDQHLAALNHFLAEPFGSGTG